MGPRVAILIAVIGCVTGAFCQQPSAPACPNLESIRLPSEDAKRLSEYARTVADSVSRIWNDSETPSPKGWSVLARAAISKDGQISAVTITKTSGDTVIDQSVSDTLRRASPFAEVPSAVDADCVAIGLNFSHVAGQKLMVTTGGGVYRVGGGVSAPKVISAPDPQYTKEAQKAKYQGTVILALIVIRRVNRATLG